MLEKNIPESEYYLRHGCPSAPASAWKNSVPSGWNFGNSLMEDFI
jgi:hypothetical protein